MEKTKKPVAFALALVLVVALGVAGAIAWLTDKSEEVTNTFTAGDINITLNESKLNDDGTLDTTKRVQENSYKMVPGDTLNKDPKVTVHRESEPCYLFIQVKKAGYEFDSYLTCAVNEGSNSWIKLPSASSNGIDVYYRTVGYVSAEEGESFYVLKDNQIKVNDDVTKGMMEALEGQTVPTLKFKAFAVQQANIKASDSKSVVEVAWDQIPADAKLKGTN